MLYLAVIFPFLAYFLPIKNKRIKIAISIAPAIFIILFRFGLGTDYFSYEFLYNQHNVQTLTKALNSQRYAMEAGFGALIYIFRTLNLPFHVFAATISLIIYVFFIKWLSDTQENLPLSIMLFNGMFFIVWVLSGLRQGLVIAIGTYFFFNKKNRLNTWQSILLILVLGQIHFSAYIYLIFLIVKKLNFSKKSLIVILAISLAFTLIPYHLLLQPFDNLKLVAKYLKYLTGSHGFWDFSGLIRLSFAGFILVFYDTFAKDQYIKNLADMSILGFSVYFLLKASEITASRMNIFTFVLIVPLFVYFAKNFFKAKRVYNIAVIALLIFSMTYLQKDLISHQNEVGLQPTSFIYKFQSIKGIEKQDYLNYDNRLTFLTYQAKYCTENLQLTSPIKSNNYDNEFIVLKNPDTNLYGILNSEGKWHIKPQYEDKPRLLDNIIILKQADGKNKYYNLQNEEIDEDKDKIAKLEETVKLIKDESPEKITTDYATHSDVLDNLFPFKDKIDEIIILSYKLPFEYSILRVDYVGKYSFFLLDDNLNIKNDTLFKRAIRYNLNNMTIASTYCGSVVLNSNGDIVYK